MWLLKKNGAHLVNLTAGVSIFIADADADLSRCDCDVLWRGPETGGMFDVFGIRAFEGALHSGTHQECEMYIRALVQEISKHAPVINEPYVTSTMRASVKRAEVPSAAADDAHIPF